jgi:predicted lipoprotein with Yx(FWY)xxD motif
MRNGRLLSAAIATCVIAIAGVAGASAATPSSKAAPTVSVGSSAYGKILVDSKGDTLYLWVKDKPDKPACSGACLDVWPFALVSGKPTAGPGVNVKLLGTITVKVNGKSEQELTYNKHPLYTYVSDVKPGIISGEGSTSFGAAWWVVSPAGNAITKKP